MGAGQNESYFRALIGLNEIEEGTEVRFFYSKNVLQCKTQFNQKM